MDALDPSTAARVGVVGAGTMGAGIAQVACLGGFETRLHDPVPAALEAGIRRTEAALAKGAERGRWSQDEAEGAAGRLSPAPALGDLAGCDLVIEAAPENLALKHELFTTLAAACGAATVLATNTSSLRVSEIAAGVPGPERVVGMHFFNPPALMKLVEVVASARSSERALATATEVAERMRRTPIRASDTPGFVVNRLARPFALESLRMLADGVADAATIDRAIRLGGGFRMGPFELIDLIGVDVNLSIARSFFVQGGEPERWRPSPIQEKLVAEGRLGRKSGEGFYAYGDEPPRSGVPLHRDATETNTATVGPTLDPAALGEIDPVAGQILDRLFAQIANEAAFALEAGVAAPDDMETAMRLGLNWPLGPLGLAAMLGSAGAAELLQELESDHGGAYAPAPLLLRAAATGEELGAIGTGS